jgi:DNA-binding MarR family transcriptional regulator
MKIEDEIKGRFRNEYHKGMINLTYTTNYLSYKFLQFLKKHDVTEQQYNVLRVLRGFNDGPSTIGFLKERMLDKNSDVSRIVDKLYERKLVERSENKEDRRQKDVRITEDGLKLLLRMDCIEKDVDKFLNKLSEDEVVTLNRLLDKIRS